MGLTLLYVNYQIQSFQALFKVVYTAIGTMWCSEAIFVEATFTAAITQRCLNAPFFLHKLKVKRNFKL